MGQTTVGFIGFGNMAQAMAKGFVTSGALPGEAISACAKHWDKLQQKTGALGAVPCQDAAQVVPSIRYVGWDVAVTPEGPLLVEGNQYPGHDIYGLPGQSPDKRGILPNLDAVVPYRSL